MSRSLLGAHWRKLIFPTPATKGAPCSSAIRRGCCARTVSPGTYGPGTEAIAVQETTEPSESEKGHTGRDRPCCGGWVLDPLPDPELPASSTPRDRSLKEGAQSLSASALHWVPTA